MGRRKYLMDIVQAVALKREGWFLSSEILGEVNRRLGDQRRAEITANKVGKYMAMLWEEKVIHRVKSESKLLCPYKYQVAKRGIIGGV